MFGRKKKTKKKEEEEEEQTNSVSIKSDDGIVDPDDLLREATGVDSVMYEPEVEKPDDKKEPTPVPPINIETEQQIDFTEEEALKILERIEQSKQKRFQEQKEMMMQKSNPTTGKPRVVSKEEMMNHLYDRLERIENWINQVVEDSKRRS